MRRCRLVLAPTVAMEKSSQRDEYLAIGSAIWVSGARDRKYGPFRQTRLWLEAAGPVVGRFPAAFVEMRSAGPKGSGGDGSSPARKPEMVDQAVQLTAGLAPDGFDGGAGGSRCEGGRRCPQGDRGDLKPAEHPELVCVIHVFGGPRLTVERPIYRLVTEVRVHGELSSQAASHFGVRTVGVAPPRAAAHSCQMGGAIRMTVAAWIPDFLMSWTAQRYRDEVRLMAEGNHTIVRVNGCGICRPDVFFDECDRRGLLVWQDLSRTSFSGSTENRKDGKTGGDPLPCDTSLYLENMKDCIMRLARASQPVGLVRFQRKRPSGRRRRGAVQNEILPALDGTRPWLPMSDAEVQPPWRKEDLHVWSGGPWHIGAPAPVLSHVRQGTEVPLQG